MLLNIQSSLTKLIQCLLKCFAPIQPAGTALRVCWYAALKVSFHIDKFLVLWGTRSWGLLIVVLYMVEAERLKIPCSISSFSRSMMICQLLDTNVLWMSP